MIWLAVHSLAVIVLTVLWLAEATGSSLLVPAVLIAAEGVIAFVWLTALAGIQARRAANVVTALRIASALAIVGLTALASPSPALMLAVFMLALLGEATDFLDGLIARRQGPTPFGARLDMETDSFFMLALSLLVIRWYDLPPWIAAAGLARYFTAIPFLFLPEPEFPRRFSLFAKSACAVAAVFLVAAAAPMPSIADSLRLLAAALAVGLLVISFSWEAVLRVRALASREAGSGSTIGLLKSVLTYYGVPFQQFAMRRFYRHFVETGDLVFDVGAHVGNRVAPLRALGARVVAVEPQPQCVRLLRRLYGDDTGVRLVAGACGSRESEAELRISSTHPTLSTLSPAWVASIQEHYGSQGIEWDEQVTVHTHTLDTLIEHYGSPRFIKVDVEGFEAEVLKGLSRPVEALSFEFLPAEMDSAIESLRIVNALGDYRFQYSMVETMRFAAPRWLTAAEMEQVLRAMPVRGRSGDVYARRLRV